jgi:hypothetical protein
MSELSRMEVFKNFETGLHVQQTLLSKSQRGPASTTMCSAEHPVVHSIVARKLCQISMKSPSCLSDNGANDNQGSFSLSFVEAP